MRSFAASRTALARLALLVCAALYGCDTSNHGDNAHRADESHHDDDHHDDHHDDTTGTRTRIAADAAGATGIVSETAGPAQVRETLTLHGIVVPDPQRVHPLHARFPGVVRSVHKRIGDTVAANEAVAVVEANDSLQRFNVVAPAAGVVVSRDVNPGMPVSDGALLTIVDLSQVWVELAAFQHDLDAVRAGQAVAIFDVDGHQRAEGIIESIAPVGSPASQSMTARVVLPNPDGRWRPGLFVSGDVIVAESALVVAVKRTAVQTLGDDTVVFEQVGDTFEARPIETGRGDATWVEVVRGLDAGTRYVTEQSYVIKADIEKSAASHDH